jgi:hypothetical protein
LALTVIWEAVPAPVEHEAAQALMLVGLAETMECDAETVPGFTVTDAVCVMPTLLAVAEIVLTSAVVELSVHCATPLPLAVCVRLTGLVVLPMPETVSVTLAFGTPLPSPSFAVTVICVAVAAPVEQEELQALIVVGAAMTVDWDADTVPAVILKGGTLVSGANPIALAWSW